MAEAYAAKCTASRDGVQVYLADDSSIEVAQQHCPCGHLVFLEVMLRHRGKKVIAKRGVAALPD